MGVCQFTIKIDTMSLFSNHLMGNGDVLAFGYHIYEQMLNPPTFLWFLKKSSIHKTLVMY